MLSSRARTLCSSNPLWCDASHYAYCTIGTRIIPSWLLSRRNICFLRSFTDWLVATNRRSITLFYKHRIHSLKVLYARPTERDKFFGRWTQKISLSLSLSLSLSFYTSSVPISFPQMQKSFPSVLLKRVYQVPLRMNSKSSRRKHAKHKKYITRQNVITKSDCWEAEKILSAIPRRVTAHKIKNPLRPFSLFLLWSSFVLVPASVYNNIKSFNTQAVTKLEPPKYQTQWNPTYQIDSLKKEIKEKLFAKADPLVDELLSCLCIKLWNLHTLVLDGVETGVLLSDFAEQLRCENAEVPVIYFTLLGAAVISPNLFLNQNARAKKRGS